MYIYTNIFYIQFLFYFNIITLILVYTYINYHLYIVSIEKYSVDGIANMPNLKSPSSMLVLSNYWPFVL